MMKINKPFLFWVLSAPATVIFSLFVFGLGPNFFTSIFWIGTVLGMFIVSKIYFHRHKAELVTLHSAQDQSTHWLESYKRVGYFPFWIGLFMVIMAISLSYRTMGGITAIVWLTELVSFYALLLPSLVLPVYANSFSLWETLSFQFKTIAVFFTGLSKDTNQLAPDHPQTQSPAEATQETRAKRIVPSVIIGSLVAILLLMLLAAGFPEFNAAVGNIFEKIADFVDNLGAWKMIALELLGRIGLGGILALLAFVFNKGILKATPGWWFSTKPEIVEYHLKPKTYKMAGMSSLAFTLPIAVILWLFAIVQLLSGGELPAGVTYANYIHAGFGFVVAAVFLVYLITAITASRALFDSTKKKAGSMGLVLALALPLYLIIYLGFHRLFLYFETYGYTVLRYYVVIVFVLMALATTALLVIHAVRLFIKPNLRGWITPLPYLTILGILFAAWLICISAIPWPTIVAHQEIGRFEREQKIDVVALCRLPVESMHSLYNYADALEDSSTKALLQGCVTSRLVDSYADWEKSPWDENVRYHPDTLNISTLQNLSLYQDLKSTDSELQDLRTVEMYNDFLAEYVDVIRNGGDKWYLKAAKYWDPTYSTLPEEELRREYGDLVIYTLSCDEISHDEIVYSYMTPTVLCEVRENHSRSFTDDWYFTIGIRDGTLVIKDSTLRLAEPEDECTAGFDRCLELGQSYMEETYVD